MFCPKCGAQVDQGNSFCQKCGAAVGQTAAVPQPQAYTAPPMSGQVMSTVKTSGMAIASLIMGIMGLSVLAIIFGAIGIGQVNKSHGAVKGKGMAVAGIILGILGFVVTIIIFGFSLFWVNDISHSLY
jgi:uncharacterized membrane protein YvbJ